MIAETAQGGLRKVDRLFKRWTTPFVWLFVCLMFASCSTGQLVDHETSHSLNLITYVIRQTAPRGIRATGPNGREFYSSYFAPEAGFSEDGTDRRERAYARYIILGDRRPYRTEVRVYRERRVNGVYDRVGPDKKLAAELANKIKEGLAKSREDRNIIDDFRPF